MPLSKPAFLLDVNVFYALTARNHIHHAAVKAWFYASPDIQWAICPFTEAGYIRNATAPRPGQIEIAEATMILKSLAKHPGYHYLPIAEDWHTLCSLFFRRLTEQSR